MKPEELPTAPSAKVDPKYIYEIIDIAESKSSSVQEVFISSLFYKTEEWVKDMKGRQASLLPLTEEELVPYFNGFMFPIACMIAARNSLEYDKNTAQEALKRIGLGMFVDITQKNLDLFVALLKDDPSGIRLFRTLADQSLGNPYADQGIKLFIDVYKAHWLFFEAIINFSFR